MPVFAFITINDQPFRLPFAGEVENSKSFSDFRVLKVLETKFEKFQKVSEKFSKVFGV